MQPTNHLPERQHPRELTELHHDHRPDIELSHQIDCVDERRVRCNRVERSALDAEYVGDFHGFSCRVAVTRTIVAPRARSNKRRNLARQRNGRVAYRARCSFMRSTSATTVALTDGSQTEWPASGTTVYFAVGQTRASSSALTIGQIMS